MNEYQEKLYKYYRRQFEREVASQDADILEDLISLQKNTERAIIENSRFDSVNEADASRALELVIVAGLATYLGTLKEHSSNVIDIAGNWGAELIAPYKVPAWNDQLEKQISDLMTATIERMEFRRFPADNKTLGSRITTIEKGAIKSVRNILSVEIPKGAGAKEIAGKVSNYIRKDDRRLWTSPFEWYRERFGYKRGQPKDILAGSLDYNAFRIARTEINHSWRNTSVKLHDGKRYLEGWEWRVSGAHPREDVCDDWEKASPYASAKDLPDGHPHCMCSIIPILIDPEKL